MERSNWIQKLADGIDLSAEPLPGVPVVELAGERRVLIELHGGVTAYSPERVCVKVSYGTVQVSGCGLRLTKMTREQLVITGRIDCVQLHRR